MSEPGGPPAEQAVVIYDDSCSFCSGTARRGQAVDRHDRMRFIGASDHDSLRSCGIDPQAPRPQSIVVVTPGGEALTESRAVAEIVRNVPVVGVLLAGGLRAARPLADPLYRLIARNRHRLGGRSPSS